MKKFLVLMLVLGLAASAQAGFVFTVNGQPQEPEIWIAPSDVIELDLELDAQQTIFSYTIDYVLSNPQAELIYDGASGSYPDLPPMTDIEFPTVFFFPGKVVEEVSGPQKVEITAGQFMAGTDIPGPAVLMTELYLHCLERTDVILEIWAMPGTIVDGEPVDGLLHTLTIHQIPEPMTIALLGLGGLFALRKRK